MRDPAFLKGGEGVKLYEYQMSLVLKQMSFFLFSVNVHLHTYHIYTCIHPVMETFFRQKAVLSRNPTVQNEKETQPLPGDLRAVRKAHDRAHKSPDMGGELLSPQDLQYQVTPFGAAHCTDSFSIGMTKHRGQSNK